MLCHLFALLIECAIVSLFQVCVDVCEACDDIHSYYISVYPRVFHALKLRNINDKISYHVCFDGIFIMK